MADRWLESNERCQENFLKVASRIEGPNLVLKAIPSNAVGAEVAFDIKF